MNFRDQLQEKWASNFMNSSGRNILHLCPRAGKIRTSIRIFEKVEKRVGFKPKILICYPDSNIQKSWEDDINSVNYQNSNIEYVTHISLGKVVDNEYDIIVCDEIHLLSEKQRDNFALLMARNPDTYIIGLTGTLSAKTKAELQFRLGLPVSQEYALEEAINDGIISDYRIKVLITPLNDTVVIDHKKKRTEKAKYRALTWVIENKGQSLFLNLARMRVIHNSIAKTNRTLGVLNNLRGKRTLVFCPNNKIAKALGCKIHTTKYKDQQALKEFISNDGKCVDHLAVCKIGNTGVSYKNLDNIVINAFDSNSENLTQRICRSLILDEKDKVSTIYIISSDEKAELNWLNKALEFFKKEKISYE